MNGAGNRNRTAGGATLTSSFWRQTLALFDSGSQQRGAAAPQAGL